MKKSILTLGIFSMMLVLTSFTSPQEIGDHQSNQNKPKDLKPVTYSEIGDHQSNQNKPKDLQPYKLEIGDHQSNQNKPKDLSPFI